MYIYLDVYICMYMIFEYCNLCRIYVHKHIAYTNTHTHTNTNAPLLHHSP